MKTKEEVIKESYGAHWDEVKKYIDQNGWLDVDDYYLISNGLNFMQIECDHTKNDVLFNRHRPIELKGLEDNNGWIKIESEEDLPKENCECWIFFPDSLDIMHAYFTIDYNVFTRDGHGNLYQRCFTHYQPIVKPKQPIY